MCSSMPSIHACGQLTLENERLQRKINSLKKKNIFLEQSIKEQQEIHQTEQLLEKCKTYKEVETQTESTLPGWIRPVKLVQKKQSSQPAKSEQPVANSQLLTLYNNLMKERDKTIQLNTSQAQQISVLKMKVQQLEEKLKDSQKECLHLRRVTSPANRMARSHSTTPVSKHEHKKLKAERDRLQKEVKRLKKTLDPKFFEEIEDVKFALQESTKLNKKYEQCLRQLCRKFGVPFPFS